MMLTQGMWIGTRNHEQFVPYPQKNADITKPGWGTKATNLRGGANIRRSKARHGEYSLVFEPTLRENLRFITDLYDGVYDTQDGVNPIYMLYPFDMDTNVLTAAWGTLAMGREDGMPLVFDYKPELVATPANTLGYPARSAQYTVAPGAVLETHYVPIPPGYRAWVGVHGETDAAGLVKVTPYSGVSPATAVLPSVLSVTTTTRVNTSFSSTLYTGIELSLVAGEAGQLTSLIVQVLKEGVTPELGGFIGGQGHNGCDFEGAPNVTAYNAKMDIVGMTAKLTEIGPWL